MKIKKIWITLSITICSLYSLSAQYYADVKVAYGIGTVPQNLYELNLATLVGAHLPSKTANASLGEGLYVEANVGRPINNFLAVDLGISFTQSAAAEVNLPFDGFNLGIDYKISGQMIAIKPSLILQSSVRDIIPYIKLGPMLATAWIKEDVQYSSGNNQDVIEQDWEMNGGISFGFNSSLGIRYILNEKIEVFAEANTISLSFLPKNKSLTKLIENGVDTHSNLSADEKEVEFVDDYNDVDYFPGNGPAKVFQSRLAYSSVTMGLGLRINI